MRKKALLPIALVLAAAGCASTGGVPCPKPEIPVFKGQRQPAEERRAHFCRDRKCNVVVEVDENCKVRVDPYYLVMAGKGETTIEWTIKGGTFARDPIRWKQAAAGEVFKFSSESSSPRQVTFTNNRKIGMFNYGVTVEKDGKTCTELDPTAINDMP